MRGLALAVGHVWGCTGARPGDVEEENEREIGRSDFLRIHAQGAVARVAVWGLIVC